MPRVKLNREEYLVRDAVKKLHGQLLAEGIHDVDVAGWLHCTPQNISRHFRNGSFSYRQILIIQARLEEYERANYG